MLIGLQLFDGDAASNRRQRLAVDALVRQRDVQTVNLQFRDGAPCVVPEIETLPLLTLDAAQVTGAAIRRKPITRELFDSLATLAAARGLDRFGFLNSDVIVTPQLFETIAADGAVGAVGADGHDAYAIARADVDDATIPDGAPVMLTAGHDMFVISVDWWRRESRRFRPYIVGEMGWDVVYTALLMCHANGRILNREPLLLHERHPPAWHADTPGARYNGMLAALDARYFSIWCRYWQALEAARAAGASGEDEARLCAETFVWRPSPVAAARQWGRSVKARRHLRRLQRGWSAHTGLTRSDTP